MNLDHPEIGQILETTQVFIEGMRENRFARDDWKAFTWNPMCQ